MISLSLFQKRLISIFTLIFEDAAKAAGLSPEHINDLRKYACGWAEDSKMVAIYNEFKNALAVAEISMSAQEKIVPKVEKLNITKDKA